MDTPLIEVAELTKSTELAELLTELTKLRNFPF